MEKYIRQIDFAELVAQSPSRINLLIRLGKIEIKKIGGVVFVINNKANLENAKKKSK